MKFGGLNCVGKPNNAGEMNSPDCRNEIIAGNRLKTRPGMAKNFDTALSSKIMFLLNVKSGFCKENYKLVIDRNGRIIIDPENLIDIPQVANLAAYWKFEEVSGIVYDETTNDNDGTYIDKATKLLLHLNGVDGATATSDESDSNHAITFNGNAQLDTAQKKFGVSSLLLDGNGDYLSAPDSADWNFAGNNLTISLFVHWNTTVSSGGWVAQNPGAGNNNKWFFGYSSPSTIYFNSEISGGDYTGRNFSWTPSADTWYHVAIVRNGNEWKFYVDGVQTGDTVISSVALPTDSGASLTIGWVGEGTDYHDGWFDEIRIVNNKALDPSGFPPTEEYNITGADYKQAGRIDYCLGFNGVENINCGSNTILNLGVNATIALWVKFDKSGGVAVSKDEAPGEYNKWFFTPNNGTKSSFHINGPSPYPFGGDWVYSNDWTISYNKWYHVVIVKEDKNYSFYLDGAPNGTDSTSLEVPEVNYDFLIGMAEGGGYFDGLLDEIMIWDVALTADEIASYLNWRYEL